VGLYEDLLQVAKIGGFERVDPHFSEAFEQLTARSSSA
jgi:hypothetical protein